MALDFSTAEKQQVPGLIPQGTTCPVHLTMRPGGAGDGGWLKRSKSGECLMMDCEFTVIDGPFARRKFWALLTVEGETDGQKQAVSISFSRLRAMLESARGILPSDESQDGIKARQVDGYQDFDGIRFVAIVGEEKGKDGYKDKNVLIGAVTPDKRDWTKIEQVPQQHRAPAGVVAAAATAPKASSSRPGWS